MDFSLGLIEIQALGHAILVLDTMTKAADVEFVAVERKLGGRLVTLVIRGKLSAVKAAIDAGFSSVMFDGSVLPFEDNAKKTAEVTAFAHARGITVEAELGHVGNAMVGNENDSAKNEDPEDTLTLPDEVVRFVEMTDVDAEGGKVNPAKKAGIMVGDYICSVSGRKITCNEDLSELVSTVE